MLRQACLFATAYLLQRMQVFKWLEGAEGLVHVGAAWPMCSSLQQVVTFTMVHSMLARALDALQVASLDIRGLSKQFTQKKNGGQEMHFSDRWLRVPRSVPCGCTSSRTPSKPR